MIFPRSHSQWVVELGPQFPVQGDCLLTTVPSQDMTWQFLQCVLIASGVYGQTYTTYTKSLFIWCSHFSHQSPCTFNWETYLRRTLTVNILGLEWSIKCICKYFTSRESIFQNWKNKRHYQTNKSWKNLLIAELWCNKYQRELFRLNKKNYNMEYMKYTTIRIRLKGLMFVDFKMVERKTCLCIKKN